MCKFMTVKLVEISELILSSVEKISNISKQLFVDVSQNFLEEAIRLLYSHALCHCYLSPMPLIMHISAYIIFSSY